MMRRRSVDTPGARHTADLNFLRKAAEKVTMDKLTQSKQQNLLLEKRRKRRERARRLRAKHKKPKGKHHRRPGQHKPLQGGARRRQRGPTQRKSQLRVLRKKDSVARMKGAIRASRKRRRSKLSSVLTTIVPLDGHAAITEEEEEQEQEEDENFVDDGSGDRYIQPKPLPRRTNTDGPRQRLH